MSRTLGPGDRNSSKHCLPNDLLPFLEREQTIVVYHHLGRRGPAWQQLVLRQDRIPARPVVVTRRAPNWTCFAHIPDQGAHTVSIRWDLLGAF